jgi:hypothetical protein
VTAVAWAGGIASAIVIGADLPALPAPQVTHRSPLAVRPLRPTPIVRILSVFCLTVN